MKSLLNKKYSYEVLLVFPVIFLAALLFSNSIINYQDSTHLTQNTVTVKMLRPLSVFLYERVGLFHVLSLLLHLINGQLLFKFLKGVFKDKNNALFTTLIFLVHPLQIETLSLISELFNLASTSLVLLSALFFQEEKMKRARLSFLLSIIFRPMFIFLPFVSFLYKSRKEKVSDIVLLAIGFISLFYFYSTRDFGTLSVPGGALGVFSEVFGTIGYGLKQFFIPYPLATYYGVHEVWLQGVFIGAALVLIIISLVSLYKKMDSSFALLVVLALTIPISFRFYDSYFLNDRHLYTLVIPLAFLLTVFVFSKFKILFYPFLMTLCALTFIQSKNWKNEELVLKNAIKSNKQDGKAINDLGMYYQRSGDVISAKREFELALRDQIKWNKYYPLNSLGLILANKSDAANFDPDLAYEMFILSMDFAPREQDKITPLFNLANLYITQENYMKAVALYEQLSRLGKKYGNSEHDEIILMGFRKKIHYLKVLKKGGYELKLKNEVESE